MTLDEMIATNRAAEKIAAMRIRPPGPEAYALAARLMQHARTIFNDCTARFPAHVDAMGLHTVQLVQLDAMTHAYPFDTQR